MIDHVCCGLSQASTNSLKHEVLASELIEKHRVLTQSQAEMAKALRKAGSQTDSAQLALVAAQVCAIPRI